MKNIFLTLFLFCSISSINAQKKAITETGQEVILNDDGTWSYLNSEDEEPSLKISLNSEKSSL